jgi:spoIIIJ-associated protein
MIEITAPNVEEAIQKGLNQLQRTQDQVTIEVVDEGSRGVFGLGSRDAVVRLTPNAPEPKPEPVAKIETLAIPDPIPTPTPQPDPVDPVETVEDTEEDDEVRITREVIEELLERMDVEAVVTTQYIDKNGSRTVHAEISGNDLSYLIGPRAETLNALQYITRLILGKELSRAVSLQVDVEGYRERRYQALETLANRMAEQVVSTGKRQYLEPMPANERRMIHLALRNHPDVVTQSVGEGDRRKVSIRPR